MNISNKVKIVVFVPASHTDIVREAMGKAGAGKIGNYTNCSFSSKGIGRFKPEAGANPTIGEVGKLESVEEERIEMMCQKDFPFPRLTSGWKSFLLFRLRVVPPAG